MGFAEQIHGTRTYPNPGVSQQTCKCPEGRSHSRASPGRAADCHRHLYSSIRTRTATASKYVKGFFPYYATLRTATRNKAGLKSRVLPSTDPATGSPMEPLELYPTPVSCSDGQRRGPHQSHPTPDWTGYPSQSKAFKRPGAQSSGHLSVSNEVAWSTTTSHASESSRLGTWCSRF